MGRYGVILLLVFPFLAGQPLAADRDSNAAPTLESLLGKKAFAAEVGKGRLALDQVFEIWGPVWNEVAGQVRRGKLTPENADRKLREEWSRALETVIREEIFYQEAQREAEKAFQDLIDRVYRSALDNARRYRRIGPTHSEVERRLKTQREKSIKRRLRLLENRFIRASGGIRKLKQTIIASGLTWDEWRERLRRKSETNYYLQVILDPLVPRQPRPADIRRYFRTHREEFVKLGAVRFRHILFAADKRGGEDAARQAAASVYEAILDQRLTFAEAARKHSDDPVSRTKGGLETEIATDPDRETWLEPIREAVRKERAGEMGTILVSSRGCHLVMLISTAPDTPIPFRQAQKQIERRMYAEKWEAEAQKLYRELKQKVRVSILAPAFPQKLSCVALQSQWKRSRPPLRRVGPGPSSPTPDSGGSRTPGKKEPSGNSQ